MLRLQLLWASLCDRLFNLQRWVCGKFRVHLRDVLGESGRDGAHGRLCRVRPGRCGCHCVVHNVEPDARWWSRDNRAAYAVHSTTICQDRHRRVADRDTGQGCLDKIPNEVASSTHIEPRLRPRAARELQPPLGWMHHRPTLLGSRILLYKLSTSKYTVFVSCVRSVK